MRMAVSSTQAATPCLLARNIEVWLQPPRPGFADRAVWLDPEAESQTVTWNVVFCSSRPDTDRCVVTLEKVSGHEALPETGCAAGGVAGRPRPVNATTASESWQWQSYRYWRISLRKEPGNRNTSALSWRSSPSVPSEIIRRRHGSRKIAAGDCRGYEFRLRIAQVYVRHAH
jgi:hypothetical protein